MAVQRFGFTATLTPGKTKAFQSKNSMHSRTRSSTVASAILRMITFDFETEDIILLPLPPKITNPESTSSERYQRWYGSGGPAAGCLKISHPNGDLPDDTHASPRD